MKSFLSFILLFLICFSIQGFTLKNIDTIYNLGKDYKIYKTTKNLNTSDLESIQWTKQSSGLTFSPSNNDVWIRCKVNNLYKTKQEMWLYTPFHHISHISAFMKSGNKPIKNLGTYGTKYSYKNKPVEMRGYSIKVELEAGINYLYINYRHKFMPLRASTFLVKKSKLFEINSNNSQLISFWRGFFIFALTLSVILYHTTKLKAFIYYYLLYLGVGLFIGQEIGDFFMLFDSDPYNIIIDIKHLGNILAILFFPYFINELIPIKKTFPKIWKWSIYGTLLMVPLWIACLIPPMKNSYFMGFTLLYYIYYSGYIFALCLVFISYFAFKKVKNSLGLLVIYMVYITAIFIEIILPNAGIVEGDIMVYKNLLVISVIEIFLFMLIVGREAMQIYKDRNNLLKKEKEYQVKITNAIVRSQEKERENIGRELHDQIGGNLAVIKQNLQEKESLSDIIDDTIEKVRNISHGLLTNSITDESFENEIADLCALSSSDKITFSYYFYNWPQIEDSKTITHLFRIVQELVQNAIKHSQGSTVYIQFLYEENRLTIMYEDNGVGFDPDIKTEGNGLSNIRDRLDIINGYIHIESYEGKGTVINITKHI